jgi:PAS domain S-box-containing protein
MDDERQPGSPSTGEPPSEHHNGGETEGRVNAEERVRYELEASEEYAHMIVDTIRESLLVLTQDLHVKTASRSFYDTFEVTPEETEGRLVYELGNGQWDIPRLRELLEDILPRDEAFDDYEVEHEFHDIGHRVMLLNARQLNHHQLILLAVEDVTERRLNERKLKRSHERFDLLVRNAKEYGIFVMNPDTRITVWNPGAERILGWTEEEILGEKGEIIFTPEDREAGRDKRELEEARNTGTALDEHWHVRKDGSRFWASGFMVALRDGDELRGWAKVLRDNTEKKRAEEEREELLDELARERAQLRQLNETLEERVAVRTQQVRALASTLTKAEQEERRRVSQILHDDLQQRLFGIQMKVLFIRQAAEADPAEEGQRERLFEEVTDVEAWLREAIEVTRRLTVDLSPPVLQGEGLTDTLAWLVTQMRELHGLEVEVHAEQALHMPDEDMRVLLFQIVRELLFNVVKHADTDRATVELQDVDNHLVVHVADRGRGFDVSETAAQAEPEGFGLFSVRERLDLFGGQMEIASAPGEGTRVTVSVPVEIGPSGTADA